MISFGQDLQLIIVIYCIISFICGLLVILYSLDYRQLIQQYKDRGKIYLKTNYCTVDTGCYYELAEGTIQSFQYKEDNSRNKKFNEQTYCLFGKRKFSILDIGCGAGEAIQDFLDDKYVAVGLDGYRGWSVHKCGGWGKYPANFFHCDLGQLFSIVQYSKRVVFDLIMSWECFEHIRTTDIDKLMANIDRHSKVGTLFIGSASYVPDGNVHRTLQDKGWWLNKFNNIGFREYKELNNHYKDDVIRPGLQSHYFFLRKEE